MKYFVQFHQYNNNGKLVDVLGVYGYVKFDGRIKIENLRTKIFDRVKKLKGIEKIHACMIHKCNEYSEISYSNFIQSIGELNYFQMDSPKYLLKKYSNS